MLLTTKETSKYPRLISVGSLIVPMHHVCLRRSQRSQVRHGSTTNLMQAHRVVVQSIDRARFVQLMDCLCKA